MSNDRPQTSEETQARFDAEAERLKTVTAPRLEPTEIDLKCWPQYFEKVLSDEKPFEVRHTDDRTFIVGDVLNLREWEPKSEEYTGRSTKRHFIYFRRHPMELEACRCYRPHPPPAIQRGGKGSSGGWIRHSR